MTEITILVKQKSDIELIKQVMIDRKIQFPVYFFEYENHFRIEVTSDYEEWELDHNIEHLFPGYEFVSDRERGTEEIHLQITRFQTAYSIYEETQLNQTKYLVKKDVALRPEWFNPEVKVFFGDEEQSYYINFVRGKYKSSG